MLFFNFLPLTLTLSLRGERGINNKDSFLIINIVSFKRVCKLIFDIVSIS